MAIQSGGNIRDKIVFPKPPAVALGQSFLFVLTSRQLGIARTPDRRDHTRINGYVQAYTARSDDLSCLGPDPGRYPVRLFAL